MAYWQRKKGKVYVFNYDREKKRPMPLPREQTSILDAKNDAEIERWVKDWEKDNNAIPSNRGAAKTKTDTVLYTPKLKRLFEDYQKQRSVDDSVGKRQLRNERIHFEKYILAYFVQESGKNDPSRWHDVAAGFKGYLVNNQQLNSVAGRKAVIFTLNRFATYLLEHGAIKTPLKLRAPKGGKRRDRKTPLPREVRPEEVIRQAKVCLRGKYPEWAIALLVGYFGCLRPEETLALTLEDFFNEDSSDIESQTYDRLKRAGLGSSLSISITKALVDGFEVGPPKNHNSNGIVTVWSVEAAKLLGSILADWPESKPFFPFSKSYLFRIYREKIRKRLKVSLHDLRRSSALYLGRTIGLEPFTLQDVMRHADLETTMLYTRRPSAEEGKKARRRDFNNVA